MDWNYLCDSIAWPWRVYLNNVRSTCIKYKSLLLKRNVQFYTYLNNGYAIYWNERHLCTCIYSHEVITYRENLKIHRIKVKNSFCRIREKKETKTKLLSSTWAFTLVVFISSAPNWKVACLKDSAKMYTIPVITSSQTHLWTVGFTILARI